MAARRSKTVAGRAAALLAVMLAPAAFAAHFPATLSEPQIELEFKRIRGARELAIGGELRWIYSFSGPDAASVERLSLRLVRDGFHIVSLRTMDARTVLRVERVETHNPGSLERRQRELEKLARMLGVPSYEGADAQPAQ
jgi:hypothetical protein